MLPPGPKSTLSGPLTLADQGSFSVGGRSIMTCGYPEAGPLPEYFKGGDLVVDQIKFPSTRSRHL